MPLNDLVYHFNQRLVEEQHLKAPPLHVKAGKVEGRFGDLRLESEFYPIRRADSTDIVAGYDAVTKILASDEGRTGEQALSSGGIVNLDRLCRTIHMLNYLPLIHESGHLFLHVHPRHILGVKRDHGAYFEEVIFRCGLSPRRVVMSVAIAPIYERQFSLLMEGLKNYQARGYGTAIKFDEKAQGPFIERYCIEFLHRFAPDYIRLSGGFFGSLERDEDEGRRASALLALIHRLDASFLVEDIEDEHGARFAEVLRAALVKGEHYERLYRREAG